MLLCAKFISIWIDKSTINNNRILTSSRINKGRILIFFSPLDAGSRWVRAASRIINLSRRGWWCRTSQDAADLDIPDDPADDEVFERVHLLIR